MEGKIEESMNSILEVKLIDLKKNRIIFEDRGRNGALEIVGEYSEICVSILVQSKFKAIRAFEFGFDKDTELS